MAKKHSVYFETFVTQAQLACQAAEYLHGVLRDFDPATLHAQRIEMHNIENKADMVKHDMMQKLAKEFVTPIEREDIIDLAGEFDEVVDRIEEVLIRIYMYNILEIKPEALQFTDVIMRCCEALKTATDEFPNFHKSESLRPALVHVNTLEEEGDAIYIESMRNLYLAGGDPILVNAWSQTFDLLESCCDACEHVADVMETVVMKNT